MPHVVFRAERDREGEEGEREEERDTLLHNKKNMVLVLNI
jgi:hypothetical protein